MVGLKKTLLEMRICGGGLEKTPPPSLYVRINIRKGRPGGGGADEEKKRPPYSLRSSPVRNPSSRFGPPPDIVMLKIQREKTPPRGIGKNPREEEEEDTTASIPFLLKHFPETNKGGTKVGV